MRCLLFVILAPCVILANNLQTCNFQNEFLNKTKFSEVKNQVGDSNLTLRDITLTNEEKGKICLKNVTKCIETDFEYRMHTDKLANFLFKSSPPFDLSNVKGVTSECRRQSKLYIESLQEFQMWAIKMYDSTAKLPSGILNGNLNQLGDFDMCLSAFSKKHNIQGQYCLPSLEVQNPQSSYLSGLYQLVQSHHHFRSKLEDPGHRVPRFSSISWALCIPGACTPKDVELGLKKAVQKIIDGTEIEVRFEVDPTMCQKKQQKGYPFATYITLIIFGIIIGWELIATLYDLLAIGEKNKWIMAFSIKENIMTSVSLKRSPSDIETVHGIRCLNALLLLASHKAMAQFFQPASNRTDFVRYIGQPFSVLGRAASLYTDPFLMMSGLLTSYSILGRLNKTKKLNVVQEYITRLIRLVPTFAALIAFCTFIFPHINSGPMWNLVVTQHSDLCKRYWWRNLLFIHNYFGFKDMCLTHTHHIGIDTQLFFLSPFMVYLIWKWPKGGTAVLVTLATIATGMRFYTTYTMNLSNYVHFGTSIQQLFDTADYMYTIPAHRSTVYILGVLLGYILKNYSHLHLTKFQLNIGNTLAAFTFCISIIGPAFMGKLDYVYNPSDGAWYAAIAPILWCFSFAWIIFTWHLGYKIAIGYVFSNKLFLLWTKISYTVYLTQFPVYFYNVGITRSSNEAGFFWMIFSLREYAWVIGISIVLTLTFELPFCRIRSLYLKDKYNQSKECSVINERKKL